ncbi:MAG: VWA domain-containing protein [Vicinamibacterales bacterium]
MARITWLVVCGVLLQAAPQQPTFRTTTALVQVDAIVLDDNGNFVPSLGPDDLTLYENGQVQKIEQFYLVTHDPVARASSIAADEAGRPAEGAHRVFVMMFDSGHLGAEGLMRVKKGAESFIMEHIGPGDVSGVLVNGELHQSRLTTDKGALLSGVRAAKPLIDTRESLLAPFREFPRIPSEHDAMRVADGARELTNRLGVKACQDSPWEPDCNMPGAIQYVENKIQVKARLYVRQARILTAQTVQSIQALVASLGKYAGRKTIVLMSEGFYSIEARATLEKLAGQAARAGVTIYSIDGRGLINRSAGNTDAVRADPGRSLTFDSGDDGPNILTAGTGGFMVQGTDDMKAAFSRIARDTSTYYVIGYQPSNPTMDGKFRKIEVKAKANGVTVRARKGYLATTLPPQEAIWR